MAPYNTLMTLGQDSHRGYHPMCCSCLFDCSTIHVKDYYGR